MSYAQIPVGFGCDHSLGALNWSKASVLGFPPSGDTAEGVKGTFLRVGCDGGKARVRVATRGAKGTSWAVHDIALDSTVGPVSIPLAAGSCFASIVRAPFTATDKADAVPVAVWSWSTAA